MRIKGLRDKSRKSRFRAIKDFEAFRGRSPDTATPDDLRACQLHMKSAIEACRTEALGGHVAACAKCGHRHVAYNSCKIPLTGRRFGGATSAGKGHCPKCQGPAARDWMAAQADDLLPVESFHVVFTRQADIARIAYWNKKAV